MRGTPTWQGPCAHLAVGGVEADEADVHRLVREAVAHLGARPPLVRHADAEVTPTKREATASGKTAADEGDNERTARESLVLPPTRVLSPQSGERSADPDLDRSPGAAPTPGTPCPPRRRSQPKPKPNPKPEPKPTPDHSPNPKPSPKPSPKPTPNPDQAQQASSRRVARAREVPG